MDVGFRNVSNIRLASHPDRWDEYMQYAGVAETIGVEVNRLTPEQVREAWPLCNTEGLIGAIQHPADGYIQPADLTQAMAKGARDRGATIYRNTTVQSIRRTESGEWEITTDKGVITCEHVVSCTGNFARKTGAMVGLDVPVIPVEHQYIVTEAHPEIKARHAAGEPEMGVLRDSDNGWYMREEAGGLILGPYEHGAPACYVDGPSDDSEYELFQEDLERIEQHIESAMFRVPVFGEVGVKKVYNGAIAYSPDGNPIIGPAPGLKNFWLSEGHSFGVTAAGGAGWQLAEWIVEGEPTIDMTGVDPRRYGNYARKATSSRKMRKPMPMSSPSTTLMKNVRPRVRSEPLPAMIASNLWVRYSARNSAGNAPTGLPRKARRRKITGPSAVPTGLNMSATKSVIQPKMSVCSICQPLPRRVFPAPARKLSSTG